MRTKLLTKEILEKFKKVWNQSNKKDPLVICKLFFPDFHRTRYATEYDPIDRIFFGYVVGNFSEWGYFSLDELLATKGKLWLGIERDRFFKPCKFSKLRERIE